MHFIELPVSSSLDHVAKTPTTLADVNLMDSDKQAAC